MTSRLTKSLAWILPFVVLLALWHLLPQKSLVQAPVVSESTIAAPPDPGPMGAFDQWVARRASGSSLAQGIALARERRDSLKKLIRVDPEAALARAVPFEVRRDLPPEIVELLETPIGTTADLTVTIACGHAESGSRRQQWTTLGDQQFEVFTYGGRAEIGSKERLSIHGMAIDEVMAMLDEPLREWTPGEVAEQGYSGRIAQLGKRLFSIESDAALAGARRKLRESEHALGPVALPAYRDLALGAIGGLSPIAMQNGGGGPATDADLPPVTFSAWTEGPKTMLYIRARFANEAPASEPLDLATAQARQAGAESFWLENSFGKTSLATTYTSVVGLPLSEGAYIGNFNLLLQHARQAAATANAAWNFNNFNFYTVVTTGAVSTFGYTGVAELGGKGSHLLRDFTTVRTASHEYGHNLGLNHSEYWLTDSASPIGRDSIPGGYVGDGADDERIEYAHKFAVMGSQDNSGDFENGRAHYAASDKNRLDWLVQADGDIVNTTTSGTFRLYRHDVPASQLANMTPGVTRAIKININASDPTGLANPYRYWLNYRFLPVDGISQEWLRNGLQVDWRRDGGGFRAVMLDMTPFSRDTGPYTNGPAYAFDNADKEDGVLVIGRTFSDPGAGIHFTPVARGGSAPNQWLDVVVNIGPQGNNAAPSIFQIAASKLNPAVGEIITLSVTATDPNGDSLAYHWEMGDNTLQSGQLNNPTQTKSWSAPGYYLVRCEVSDMKGGRVEATRVITVGSPFNNGAWINTAGGSWGVNGNWSGGTIAGGEGNTADFSSLNITANATITLDGARAIGNLVFGDTNPGSPATWILNNGSNGSLMLAASMPAITVSALGTGSFATIGARLTGSNGFTKNGAGNLILNNAGNSLGGPVTIHEGNVQLNNAALTRASGVTLTGGALVIATGAANPIGGSITFNGGNLQFNVPPGNDFSAQFSAAANQPYRINVVGGNEAIFNTNLASPGGTLLKLGTGTLVLNVSNSYTGGTTLSGGTLRYGATNALGGGGVAINGNATLQAGQAATLANPISIANVISATFDTGVHNTTLVGALTGAGTLIKSGAGSLVLASGPETTLSGGITINAGRLEVLNGLALSNAPGAITVASGAVFNYSRNFLNGNDLANPITIGGPGEGGMGALNLRGNVTATGNITLAADATISHDFNNATISGAITGINRTLTLRTLTAGQPGMTVGGPINLGTGGITVQGAANSGSFSVRLSGNNTYSGETNVVSGTLMLSGSARLGDSAGLRISNGAVVHLDFTGIDTVGSLVLNGVTMVDGTYGSPASAASNKSAFFAGTGVLQVGPPGYETWAILGGVGTGPNGDSDQDGLANLIEYALVDGGERGTLTGSTLTFTKRGAPYGGDLVYILEVSPSLAPGSWTPAVTHGPAQIGTPISHTLTPPKQFARLRVVYSP